MLRKLFGIFTLGLLTMGAGSAFTAAASATTYPVVTLGFDKTGDGPTAVQGAPSQIDQNAGTDLTKANITYNAAKKALQFNWHVAGLPPTGTTPEAVLYRAGITVNGKKKYVLQAKFSNLLSTSYTDDPTGPPSHVGGTFQLRGNCGPLVPQAGTVSPQNCHSLAYVTGSFNTTSKTISMLVPLGKPFAKDITHGAVLTPYSYDAAGPIVAAYSAFVANADTEDAMDWTKVHSYTIP